MLQAFKVAKISILNAPDWAPTVERIKEKLAEIAASEGYCVRSEPDHFEILDAAGVVRLTLTSELSRQYDRGEYGNAKTHATVNKLDSVELADAAQACISLSAILGDIHYCNTPVTLVGGSAPFVIGSDNKPQDVIDADATIRSALDRLNTVDFDAVARGAHQRIAALANDRYLVTHGRD
jgi:hypothetical protein